jgi:hypothetical protein
MTKTGKQAAQKRKSQPEEEGAGANAHFSLFYISADGKRRLEAHIANMLRQKKDLKATLVELETAQRTKTNVTIGTWNNKGGNLEEQRQAGGRKERDVAAVAVDRWDLAALDMEQLADKNVRLILQAVEAEQRPD